MTHRRLTNRALVAVRQVDALLAPLRSKARIVYSNGFTPTSLTDPAAAQTHMGAIDRATPRCFCTRRIVGDFALV